MAILDLDKAATLDLVGLEVAAILDQDVVEPESAARLLAARQSEARSHQEALATLDRDEPELQVSLDRAAAVDRASLDRDEPEVVVTLDRDVAVDHQARSDERDDREQRARQAHRYNTKFQHALMPYMFFY